MKLWKLERIGDVGYDENVGFVVASHTEDGARIYAVARKHGDEPSSVWENCMRRWCEKNINSQPTEVPHD